MKVILIIMFSFLMLQGCKSNSVFEMEENNKLGSDVENESSPTEFYWISLETTKKKAVKNTSLVLDKYYPLIYSPKKNVIEITSIGGLPTIEKRLEVEAKPPKPVYVSKYSGATIYEIFFNKKRSSKLDKLIKKHEDSIYKINIDFKTSEAPEELMYEKIIEAVAKKLVKVVDKKIGDKDYFIATRFLIVGLDNFKYKNRSKNISFEVKVLFLFSKPKKIDYAAHLEKIEDMINDRILNQDFEAARNYNEIYKKITPEKIRYYENSYNINMALKDYNTILMKSLEMIEEVEEDGIVKKGFTQFGKVYQSQYSKRKWRKLKYKLGKIYKLFRRGRIDKFKFVEKLKDIMIDNPLK